VRHDPRTAVIEILEIRERMQKVRAIERLNGFGIYGCLHGGSISQ
jgi:hypothetical protein